MRNRTPTQVLDNGALRYGVYDEAGNLLRYEYLALEDDPTDPGTDLSKATLLQDSTEVSLFGSAIDRTIDDAFAGIAGLLKLIKDDMAIINLTVTDTVGRPLPGVLVQGILSESGTAVYSNASGVASGYIGEGSQVIKVTGYADIVDYSETLTVAKGTTITKTLTLTTRNFLAITSSRNVKFSGNVEKIDFSVTSGGSGGDGGNGYENQPGGGGGNGGGTVIENDIEISPNTNYPAVIGAGGQGGKGESSISSPTDGSNGGASSFMGTSSAGGAGGGIGGAGRITAGDPGGDATSAAFKSFTTTSNLGGGGGGGTSLASANPSAGGQVGGGAGGITANHINGYDAAANTGGGGGGGGVRGSGRDGDNPVGGDGGKGGSGFIGIRMHLKSAT